MQYADKAGADWRRQGQRASQDFAEQKIPNGCKSGLVKKRCIGYFRHSNCEDNRCTLYRQGRGALAPAKQPGWIDTGQESLVLSRAQETTKFALPIAVKVRCRSSYGLDVGMKKHSNKS